MFLITARHYIGYSGVAGLEGTIQLDSLLSYVSYAIIVLGQCAPNIFVLISGYFLINSQFKSSRIIKIWAETWFYSVIFFIVGILINGDSFSLSKLIFAFTPILSRHYWFAVAYIALLIVSPFLNKLVKTISLKEYTFLVICGAIMLSAWTTFIFFSQGVVTGGNTGLLWCIYLYLLGGYINLTKEKTDYKKIAWIGFAFSFVLEYMIFRLSSVFSFLNNIPVTNDDSFFNLILSVSVFIIFLNCKIDNKMVKKIVIPVSLSSFGIYLIQENCMIREYLWLDLVNANKFSDNWMLFGILIIVFIVLVILSLLCNGIFNIVYSKCYEVAYNFVMKVKKQ